MKRSRLKAKGKARRHYEDVRDERDAWKLSRKPQCWVCEDVFRYDRLDIHEILRRSKTLHPFGRWNLCLVCRRCHESHEVAASNRESMTRMLARKRFHDVENYSLLEFLCARDERAMEFITDEEIKAASKELGYE